MKITLLGDNNLPQSIEGPFPPPVGSEFLGEGSRFTVTKVEYSYDKKKQLEAIVTLKRKTEHS